MMGRATSTHPLTSADASEIFAESAVVLRLAFPEDDHALGELALLDSSKPLARPILLAEVGEEVQAALSLANGAVLADPFRPTAGLIRLLRARAEQLQAKARGTRRAQRPRRRSLRSLISPPLVHLKVRT